MSNIDKCPDWEQLLAWLDGEIKDELIASHICECQSCREFISAMEEENHRLLELLDAVSAPDLTGQVMAVIKESEQRDAGLFNVLAYLVTVGAGLLLVLGYNTLPGIIDFQIRPVSVVKFLTGLDRLAFFINDYIGYLAERLLTGDPLIPPLVLVLIIISINVLGKRRLSDV